MVQHVPALSIEKVGDQVTYKGTSRLFLFTLAEYPAGHFPGRIFSATEVRAGEEFTEDVFIARNPQDSYCTCKACECWGTCGHLAAIGGLLDRGEIEDPGRPVYPWPPAELMAEPAPVGPPPF